MSRMLLAAAAALLLLPSQALAQEGRVRDALEAVRDAADRAADADKVCRKAVLSDLKDAADGLKRLKADFDRHRAKRLVSDLEDIRKNAREDCPKKVKENLRDAIDSLERALEKDKDRGDDGEREDRGRHHGDRDHDRGPRCWSPGDPGCGHTKGGQAPMDRAAFDSLMQAVRSTKPNVFSMKDVVASTLGGQALTCQQLAAVVEEFRPNSIIMLDVIKLAAPRLVDPQNGAVVSTKLAPNTILIQDAARVLAAHRGD
jgi:hypothetical protein